MKMIIAIVGDNAHHEISESLINQDYRVTQLATTSGFLREGSTTLMIGVEAKGVEEALQVIRDSVPKSTDNEVKKVTLYVINVKNFNRL